MSAGESSARALLTAAYFKHREISDTAFKAGNGALCVGAACTASLIAEQFQLLGNFANTDEAVERMRQLRKPCKEVDC